MEIERKLKIFLTLVLSDTDIEELKIFYSQCKVLGQYYNGMTERDLRDAIRELNEDVPASLQQLFDALPSLD